MLQMKDFPCGPRVSCVGNELSHTLNTRAWVRKLSPLWSLVLLMSWHQLLLPAKLPWAESLWLPLHWSSLRNRYSHPLAARANQSHSDSTEQGKGHAGVLPHLLIRHFRNTELKTDFRSSGGRRKEIFMCAGPSFHAELMLLVEGLYVRDPVLTGKLVQVSWEWPWYKIPLECFQRRRVPDEVHGILGSGCPDTHSRLQVGWREEAGSGPKRGFPTMPWVLLLCTKCICHSDEKHPDHSTYGNHIF